MKSSNGFGGSSVRYASTDGNNGYHRLSDIKKRIFIKKISSLSAFILPALVFIAVLAIVLSGLSNTSKAVGKEGLRVAREAVVRAAVCCYAIEGSYPDSYEYLRDNYGLSINEERYHDFYDIFASNIMQDITVVELGAGE